MAFAWWLNIILTVSLFTDYQLRAHISNWSPGWTSTHWPLIANNGSCICKMGNHRCVHYLHTSMVFIFISHGHCHISYLIRAGSFFVYFYSNLLLDLKKPHGFWRTTIKIKIKIVHNKGDPRMLFQNCWSFSPGPNILICYPITGDIYALYNKVQWSMYHIHV